MSKRVNVSKFSHLRSISYWELKRRRYELNFGGIIKMAESFYRATCTSCRERIARPSVRPPHGRISEKFRLQIGLCNFHRTIPPITLVFAGKFYPEILTGSPWAGASNKSGVRGENSFMRQYLENGRIYSKVTINDKYNKKAQLTLSNPRDVKACKNCSNSTCFVSFHRIPFPQISNA